MTIVIPPGFFQFIMWLTEQAQREGSTPSAPGTAPPFTREWSDIPILLEEAKPKRKASPANRRYAAAFKKCKSKHMKKNGSWKKGGFKRCVKEAHRMAKR